MGETRPSKTAYKVAVAIVGLGTKPEMDGVLPTGTAEATEQFLIASGALNIHLIPFARSRWINAIHEAFDWMLPGMYEGLAYRKAFYDHQVKDGISAGATQVLVLGAGYDTLGWRLAPVFPDVSFFETDHPATACFKAKGIKAMGQRNNLYLLKADLSKQKLTDILMAHDRWDSKAKTVILAEGLLMYLPEGAVRDLFVRCAEITGTGSRIAFDYVGIGADGRPYAGRWTRLILWFAKVTGEPWLWGMPPGKLANFLESTGWSNAPELLESANKISVEYLGTATR